MASSVCYRLEMEGVEIMNALILDGATGKRMQPITNWIPKDLMKIDGVSLLERHIEILKNIKEIERIIVTTHQHSNLVDELLTKLNLGWWTDKHRIESYYEKELKGTAYATLKAWERIDKEKPLLIIYGDVFFSDPGKLFDDMIYWYQQCGKASLLGAGEIKDPPTGIMVGKKDSTIQEFIEHPSSSQLKGLSHAGLAILHPKLFPLLENNRKRSLKDKYHLGEHFFPIAVKTYPCYACNIGEHYDIGTIEQYCGLQEKIYNRKLKTAKANKNLKEVFKALLNTKGIIYLIGNGGSLAVAQHASLDLSKAASKRAICLSDPGIITAYANDITFVRTYQNYLKNFIQKEDILIAFSASGESLNILQAIEHCNKTNIFTVGITSKDSTLARISKIAISFDEKDPKVLEDLFSITMHLIVRLIQDVQG